MHDRMSGMQPHFTSNLQYPIDTGCTPQVHTVACILSTLISYTPLHQRFRDFHRTIECLLVILSHDNAAFGRPTTLRRRIHPRESTALPKDTNVSTIDIIRGDLLCGQFPQDALQFFD